MERVKVLIDKLVQQQQQNESIEAMLITTQLLQNELLLHQRKNKPASTSKVAVVMPSGASPAMKKEYKPEPPRASVPEPESAPAPEPLPAPKPIIEEPVMVQPKIEEPRIEKPKIEEPEPEPVVEQTPVTAIPDIPGHEAYLPPRPRIEEPAPEPEKKTHYVLQDTQFDAIEETPTLAQYQPAKKDSKIQKEINELIGESKETFNDRLKENKKELAHVLKDTPIKDLRKAIGVNDRFVFVNELFRGDETMYERSIKTINGFHILPEAEYWINRELKVKLGWDDYKDSVQHFYHLVRRRFS